MIFKIAVVFLAIMIMFYIFTNYMNLKINYDMDIQNNSEVGIEGFESSGSDAEKVKNNLNLIVSKIDDKLLIDKYRKTYEKIIEDTDELFNQLSLMELAKLEDATGEETSDGDGVINISKSLHMFDRGRDALENLQKYLDSK